MAQDIEKRQDKLEEAINKLTDISSNISKVVAVQEQRLTQQEKDTSFLFNSLEKRKEELDSRMKEMYAEIKTQENLVANQLTKMSQDMNKHHESLESKISQLEKFNYITIGAVAVISWAATNLFKFLKVF